MLIYLVHSCGFNRINNEYGLLDMISSIDLSPHLADLDKIFPRQ